MTDTAPWYEAISIPALMRAARNTYAAAIRQALAEADCEDLPRNGAFVIGSIALSGAPLSRIIYGLDVSKQAAGQLVDTLVLRGYVERAVDPEDRRRLTLTLTERGMAANLATRAAIERIDANLAGQVPAEAIASLRTTLAALAVIRREVEQHQPGD